MEEFNTTLESFWNKLYAWAEALIAGLPNFILATVVMVLALLVSRYVRKYFNQLLNKLSKNHTINGLLANVATTSFLLIMLFVVLGILGLDTALTSLLAGAGVVGLAIGLAVQDPLMNAFSGILMSAKDLYNIGDLVETNGFMGYIQDVSLRTTIIRQMSGEDVLLPNKSIIQNPLINYSAASYRRIELSCGVSYGEDLEKVKQITIQALEDAIDYDKTRPLSFFYEGFGDSSIDFAVRFWLFKPTPALWFEARSQAIIAIKKAYDANGITIPFPIRTLDFGIKGGEKLSEHLPDSFEKTTKND